ncbi:hypothetical protein DB347_04845 [Opitutaceae bacterium EW11]|nr:hypothetical protein DB347_04845 [Opitutaceae bacterium EW11]
MSGVETVVRHTLKLGLWLMVAAGAAGATFERKVERTCSAEPGARVAVEVSYGSIRVVAVSGAEVRVTLTQSADLANDAAAEREWKNVNLEIEPSGSGAVRIRANDRRSLRWSWEKWPPSTVALEVAVPPGAELDLLTRQGDVTVADGMNAVRVRDLSGAVFVGQVAGAVTIEAGQGDVTLTDCGGELRVVADSGSVLVGRARSSAELTLSAGNLEVQRANGRLRADVASGELKVGLANPLGGEVSLKGNGDVILALGPRTRATIDARTEPPGLIHVRDLVLTPRAGHTGEPSLEGDVNGGGPRVVARSKGGNIRLIGLPDDLAGK